MVLPPLSAATPLSESPAGVAVGIFIVVLFHASLYAGAQYFFATHLYRDYEVQRPSVQRLFCATFTACVAMLQLLLLELLHVLNPLVRQWVWNVDLVCVLLLLYVVLPVSIVRTLVVPRPDSSPLGLCSGADEKAQSSSSASASPCPLSPTTGTTGASSLSSSLSSSAAVSSQTQRSESIVKARTIPRALREWLVVLLFSCALLPPLWFCFCQSGRLLSLDSAVLSSLSYTERLLAYVGVCGVTVVSALAGFGSVNYPYRNVAAFLYPTTQSEVACVEQRLLQTLNLISEKKKAHLHLQASLNPTRALLWPTPTADVLHAAGSSFSSWSSSFSSSNSSSRSLNRADVLRGRSLSRKRLASISGASFPSLHLQRRGFSGEFGRTESEFKSEYEREPTGALRPLVNNNKNNNKNKMETEQMSVVAGSGAQLRGRSRHASSVAPSSSNSPLSDAASFDAAFTSPGTQTPRVFLSTTSSFLERLSALLPSAVRDWIERVAAFLTGRKLEQQCLKLQSEIEALEELSRELFVGLDDLVQSRAQALYGRTWRGKLSNVLGWAMSGVCAYRVFMSAANVLLDRVNTTDPATRTLEILLHLLHIPLNVALLTPYLSLLLLGWIIALTIRGFFEKLLTLFRYISTAVSSNVFALVMSEVMGMYFSACLLLTRVYLPQTYRDALAQVLAPSLDLRAFHLYFDRVFVLSSLSCAVSIAFTHRRAAEKLKSL